MFNSDSCYRLYRLFSDKCEVLTHKFATDEEDKWTDYLSSIDCSIILRKEIDSNFVSLINDESSLRRDVVCIPDPFSTDQSNARQTINGQKAAYMCDYILVPRELAMKILTLGGMP